MIGPGSSDPPQPQPPRQSGLRFALRALGHRNYRLYFAGQSVSLVGTWLTRVATSWLVYRLTGSAAMLGLVGFCGLAPTLLSPLAGVVVDRLSRHRVLVVTQVLSMLQSFALAAFAFVRPTVLEIALLQLFQGAVDAFDAPARQAFVVELVEDRDDLPNAIALNSSMFNGARLVGPSVAGMLIAAVGEGGCFLIDGVSYLAVIASLLAMRVRPAPAARREEPLGALAGGFRYVVGSRTIRSLLLLVGAVSLVGMPYTVLMPLMASGPLGGGASTLGVLMAASGLGALAAALRLAARRTVLGLGRVIAASTVAFGAALAAFAASRSPALSIALMAVSGFGLMMQNAATNTVLQTIVAPELRGRVMAFYTMAVMGTAPFGSLAAGALAARIGAPWTLGIGGVACACAGAGFASILPALREQLRPVYRRLGILPEIADALGEVERTRRTPVG